MPRTLRTLAIAASLMLGTALAASAAVTDNTPAGRGYSSSTNSTMQPGVTTTNPSYQTAHPGYQTSERSTMNSPGNVAPHANSGVPTGTAGGDSGSGTGSGTGGATGR